jgi:lambda family phage portal protein
MPKTKSGDRSLLDRAIAYISPKWGLQRQHLRARGEVAGAIISGYIGGRHDRNATKTWFTAQSSADTDTIYDLKTLRGRSRDLVRNTPIATGAVGTMVSNVIGSGLALRPLPNYDALGMTEDEAEAWSEKVEREWRMWAESTECDITRTQTFYGLQALAFRSMIESGDIVGTLPFVDFKTGSPYQLRIQLIEADRLDVPGGTLAGVATTTTQGNNQGAKIIGGVELDQYGGPIAYHIASQHPGDIAFSDRTQWTRVPAFTKTGVRQVIHVFDRLRPGQTRGVPMLAPVMEALKSIDRYTEAELMAAVVSALFTAFITSETGEGLGSDSGFADEQSAIANESGQNTQLVSTKNEIAMGSGSIVDLVPGESVTIADPKRPNVNFDPFVAAIIRQIGVAIGMPYEVMVKHFTASYSASRAALLQAWQVFKQRRDFISTGFCTPVYAAWMEEAIAIGRIDAPGYLDDAGIRAAYLECDWVGEAPLQIDPLKEIQAAQLRVELGVSDLEDETMELRGKDWDDVQAQRAKEHKMRVEAGLEAEITANVPPKVAKGEGLQSSKKTDPNIPPADQPSGPPQGSGSDLETGDEEK